MFAGCFKDKLSSSKAIQKIKFYRDFIKEKNLYFTPSTDYFRCFDYTKYSYKT